MRMLAYFLLLILALGLVQAETFGYGRTNKPEGADGNFSGRFIDLNFVGTVGFDDFIDNTSVGGGGGGNTTEEMQDAVLQAGNITIVYDDLNNEFGVNQTWLNSIYAKIVDLFSGSWNDLTDVPAGFADDVDNDTTYSHLTNFTDDLGDRGYTSLSNFTNDPGYITGYTETDPLWSANESLVAFLNENVTFDEVTMSKLIVQKGFSKWETDTVTIAGLPFPYLKPSYLTLNVGAMPGMYLYDTATNGTYLHFPDVTGTNNWYFIHDRSVIPANFTLGYTGALSWFKLEENMNIGGELVVDLNASANDFVEAQNLTSLNDVGLKMSRYINTTCPSSQLLDGFTENGTPICDNAPVPISPFLWLRFRDDDLDYVDADTTGDVFDFYGGDGITTDLSGDSIYINLTSNDCGIPSATLELEKGNPGTNTRWSYGNGQSGYGVPMACDGTIKSYSAGHSGTGSQIIDISINNVNQGVTLNITGSYNANWTQTNIAVSAGDFVTIKTLSTGGTISTATGTINVDYG